VLLLASETAPRSPQHRSRPPPPTKNQTRTAFYQTWCRGRKHWESESLCLACHAFSRHAYRDADFESPEEAEKRLWTAMVAGAGAAAAAAPAAKVEA
jgi:hypothetical protein